MYAIVDIAGQQFKVEKGKKVFVHRLAGEAGAVVSFDKVLLIGSQEKVNVGTPYISKAVVTAQILSHLRGDKILIFKKKRRKGYQLQNGHRQDLTELLIEEISETGPAKKAEAKKETDSKKEVETKKETVLAREEAVAAKTPSAAKKTTTVSRTGTAKKPAAKPAAASAEAKKKAAVKAGSGPAASKAKPAASKAKPAASKAKPAASKAKPEAKKPAEKKPVEKKK